MDLSLGVNAGPRPALSVVVPVYNEEAVLAEFHRRLRAAAAAIDGGFELVYVDDGSSDGTAHVLRRLHEAHPEVAVVRLTRNFGKENAMSAGLRVAQGEAVALIDADLQDPPELLPAMLAACRRGADVVNMRRRSRRGESWLKRATAHAFYRVFNRLSEVAIAEDAGDFRLLSRRAVDALNALPEQQRFMKGLFAWIGFRQVTLDYDREPRGAGKSKWRYRALWNFALQGITGFSVAPLKAASYAGLLSAAAALAGALYFLLKALLYGDPVPGFPALIVSVLFLGGLQLMALGVLGEYLGRLFVESKRRPLYLVEDYRPARLTAKAQ